MTKNVSTAQSQQWGKTHGQNYPVETMNATLIQLHFKTAKEAASAGDLMTAKLQALEALRLINLAEMDAREFAEPKETALGGVKRYAQ